MTDRCLLRVRPSGAEPFTSYNEWINWEPCPNPVTYSVRDHCASGGWLRLCAEHSKGLPRPNPPKPEEWE